MSDADAWRRRFERERAARKHSETLLSEKSRDLYQANQLLEARAQELSESLERVQGMQDQLVEREKLAALGGLVAGVAHEINTPLGVAITAVSLAEERLDHLIDAAQSGTLTRGDMRRTTAALKEAIDLAMQNLNRGASLVQSFKKVSADQISQSTRLVTFDEFVLEVLASLRPMLRRSQIAIETDLHTGLHARIDSGSLIQILTNLIQNACLHAFKGTDSTLDSRFVRLAARLHDASLEIIIEDNGLGMPQDVVDHVFDPFFTTTRDDGGSGLGMHITHNLVTNRFEGTIACDSQLGRGTTWTMTLPLGTDAIAPLEA